jgi:LAS superfamily LD-carboxypeptidase LdcB
MTAIDIRTKDYKGWEADKSAGKTPKYKENEVIVKKGEWVSHLAIAAMKEDDFDFSAEAKKRKLSDKQQEEYILKVCQDVKSKNPALKDVNHIQVGQKIDVSDLRAKTKSDWEKSLDTFASVASGASGVSSASGAQVPPAPATPKTEEGTTSPEGQNEAASSVLGHHRYENATSVVNAPNGLNYYSGRTEKVSPEALTQLEAMDTDLEAHLKTKGFTTADFSIFSGYRSIADQKPLFFDPEKGNPLPEGVNEDDVITPAEAKILEANKNAKQRAMSSAPPGYSEHHTGVAFDFGLKGITGNPDSVDTWNTGAYKEAHKWLKANAVRYGFEQSFTGQNGVQNEPWHWRWVGNQNAANVFKLARNSDKPLLTP